MHADEFARPASGWVTRNDTLKARTVLIVGAAGGLGRASALAAARAGATLILLGRKPRLLEKLCDEIEALGAPAPSIYPLDLVGATARDYGVLADTIEREYGRLDGIVNAAAHFDGLQPIAHIEPDAWLKSMHVNISAPFLLLQACAPLLHTASDASVVLVLDDVRRAGKAFWGGYGVAKHALHGLLSILREEWDGGSVRVHGLLPAPMRTSLRRTAYFGENTLDVPLPDAAANAVVYLLSADAMPVRGRVLDLREAGA